MIAEILNFLLFGGLAALGFGLLFNVPKRTLPMIFAGGALSVLTRNGLFQFFGFSFELASFLGAFVAGLWSVIWVHRVHVPGSVIGIAAIIPLVPGVFAYKGLMGVVNLNLVAPSAQPELLVDTISFLAKAFLIVSGIAIGMSIPIIMDRKWTERKRSGGV